MPNSIKLFEYKLKELKTIEGVIDELERVIFVRTGVNTIMGRTTWNKEDKEFAGKVKKIAVARILKMFQVPFKAEKEK